MDVSNGVYVCTAFTLGSMQVHTREAFGRSELSCLIAIHTNPLPLGLRTRFTTPTSTKRTIHACACFSVVHKATPPRKCLTRADRSHKYLHMFLSCLRSVCLRWLKYLVLFTHETSAHVLAGRVQCALMLSTKRGARFSVRPSLVYMICLTVVWLVNNEIFQCLTVACVQN